MTPFTAAQRESRWRGKRADKEARRAAEWRNGKPGHGRWLAQTFSCSFAISAEALRGIPVANLDINYARYAMTRAAKGLPVKPPATHPFDPDEP